MGPRDRAADIHGEEYCPKSDDDKNKGTDGMFECGGCFRVYTNKMILHERPVPSSPRRAPSTQALRAAFRFAMLQPSDMPPQRNALVLPDLLNLDLRNESRGGRCRTTSRAAEDKENVNPNSLRLQKQRRLAKARAAKKAAVPSAPEAATAPTAELSAPAASSAPAPKVEPRALHASHNALKRELSSIVSPPLAEIQGRHTRFMSRTSAGRTGSSLRDGYVCGDEMMMMSDSSPSGPVIR